VGDKYVIRFHCATYEYRVVDLYCASRFFGLNAWLRGYDYHHALQHPCHDAYWFVILGDILVPPPFSGEYSSGRSGRSKFKRHGIIDRRVAANKYQ
jgi:hypothetical protein